MTIPPLPFQLSATDSDDHTLSMFHPILKLSFIDFFRRTENTNTLFLVTNITSSVCHTTSPNSLTITMPCSIDELAFVFVSLIFIVYKIYQDTLSMGHAFFHVPIVD